MTNSIHMAARQKSNWMKLRDREMDWTVFRLRARILRSIRRFFDSKGFLEIDAPLLTPCPTLDANIRSIQSVAHDNRNESKPMFLHTSPEHAMKKLLAAGADRIYFLGKVFRDGECTRLHNPEFTMLEWYRSEATYEDIINDTQEVVHAVANDVFDAEHLKYQGKKIDLSLPWDRITLRDLFVHETGIDLENYRTADSLKEAAASLDVHYQEDDDWETLFFRIFLEKIERKLGFPKPVFLLDYPLSMGLMARRKPENPRWVERAEIYIAGLECANGYSELTHPDEQKKRFLEERRKKTASDNASHPIDWDLISALESGLSPCAGMALGVDRLVMLLTDKTDIQDVLLFPHQQWDTP